MPVYYNENDPYCCEWLRNLIQEGLIPDGEVDSRSIKKVKPDDLKGFTTCHFFAGIGGWAYAARLAGWPDERPLWTGSCPCQPFSVAGKGAGANDKRHLWPDFFRLIHSNRPSVIMGEQVAGTLGYHWFDGVHTDLAGEGYASRSVDIPACAVDAPHIRNRIYWVAVADSGCSGRWTLSEGRDEFDRPDARRQEAPGRSELDGHVLCQPNGQGWTARRSFSSTIGHGSFPLTAGRNGTFWSYAQWLDCADGKSRRIKPGIRLMAHGVPARLAQLRALGNAIVPQVAAEVISAFMDV